MKLKRNLQRWLSILLAVAVSLSSVMPTPVYAAEVGENEVTSSIQSSIEHEMEKEAEGRSDAELPDSDSKTQNPVTETSICSPLFKFI